MKFAHSARVAVLEWSAGANLRKEVAAGFTELVWNWLARRREGARIDADYSALCLGLVFIFRLFTYHKENSIVFESVGIYYVA